MRIAVVGAGSIGCYIGAHLASVADVTLVGRARVVDAICEQGLTATTMRGTAWHVPADRLHLDTEVSAVSGAEVVLVTTKTVTNHDIAAQIGPYLTTDTVVISLQNGVRNAQVLDEGLQRAFPSRASRPLVLSAVVHHNVVATDDAVYLATTSGGITVKDHPRVDPFVRTARRGGLSVAVEPDMRPVLMNKLLLNLNNAVNALSGRPLRDELRDPDYRRVLAACQAEALAVSKAAGVTPSRMGPLPAALMPAVLRSPTPVFAGLARTSLAVTPQARSSMADDLGRHRRTEIDELQGMVVALGERYGIATPVSERLVELVVAAEGQSISDGDHRTYTGGELRAAVGL
ncbi:2-dehydropantoate 2-reductase [Janibacter sp. UYMM211]|uniref:2-dehydropantoate 2-reductase n=1 Tax=Janibacter sp. UYMM211 TaxID=3156342 RepID=UPI003399A6F1